MSTLTLTLPDSRGNSSSPRPPKTAMGTLYDYLRSLLEKERERVRAEPAFDESLAGSDAGPAHLDDARRIGIGIRREGLEIAHRA